MLVQIVDIDASTSQLIGDISYKVSRRISDALSYQMPNFEAVRRAEEKKAARQGRVSRFANWDGYYRLFNYRNLTFPAGLKDVVADVLSLSGYSVAYDNEDSDFELDLEGVSLQPVPHQVAAVTWALKKRRGIIVSATSSGKSLIAFLITKTLVESGKKVLVTTTRRHLVNQLKSDFDSYYKGWLRSYDGFVEITTVAATRKFTEEKWLNYDAIISDEIHEDKNFPKTHVAKAKNAYFRIGMTGTFPDSPEMMEIIGAFGPKKEFATNNLLLEQGFIATPHFHFLYLDHGDDVPKKYEDEVEFIINNPIRNAVIAKVASSLDGNTIILTSRIEHSKLLQRIISRKKECFHIDGSVNKKELERIINYVKNNTGVVLCGTFNILSTGVSIRNLHNLVFAMGTKSYVRYFQSIGRVLRKCPDGSDVHIYDFIDIGKRKTYSYKQSVERMKYLLEEGYDFDERKINVKIAPKSSSFE